MHALACHPGALRFATAGTDASLRLWALPRGSSDGAALIGLLQLPAPCAAICFDSSGGAIAAVGCRTPRFYIVAAASLERVLAADLADGACGGGAVRFSPNDRLLAIGDLGGRVHLRDATQGFAPIAVLEPSATTAAAGGPLSQTLGAAAPAVTSIDWAADSVRLRCGSAAGDARHWDATARRLVSPAAHGDAEWASCSVLGAWGSHGAVRVATPPCSVRALERSPEGDVIATAESDGGVRLFRWPATAAGAGHRRYGGHAAAVSGVAFSFDDRFVVSTAADGASPLVSLPSPAPHPSWAPR
jgi:WD40 repeat protein